MKILKIILLLVPLYTVTSCVKNEMPVKVDYTKTTIKFSTQILPIFQTNCTSCHSPGGQSPDLTTANAYNQLKLKNLYDTKNPSNSTIYKMINTGGAMNQYWGSTSPSMMLTWITQGALNN